MWKRLDDLDPALDQDVGPPAIIAGNPADQNPERKADRHAEQPDGQRDPRPVDHSRQQIAAEPIGPRQKKLPADGRTHQVQITWKQPPDAILAAVAEEADRLPRAVVRIDAFEGVHIEPVVVAINKRGDQLAFVEDADPLWRSIDEISITGVQAIWSEDLANQYRCVHNQKDHTGHNGDAVAAQLPPHHPPLRRHIKALLRRRHSLDGIRVERRVGNIVRQPVGDRRRQSASPVPWDAACDSHLAHSRRPACSRIRGSRTASARSDMKTPMTVRNAINIKNEPAKYMS